MSEFTPEEVSKLRELLEIEEIRKVRLLYSHLMDSHRIDELADLFTPDGVCVRSVWSMGGARDNPCQLLGRRRRRP
jgi:hypothetical protein